MPKRKNLNSRCLGSALRRMVCTFLYRRTSSRRQTGKHEKHWKTTTSNRNCCMYFVIHIGLPHRRIQIFLTLVRPRHMERWCWKSIMRVAIEKKGRNIYTIIQSVQVHVRIEGSPWWVSLEESQPCLHPSWRNEWNLLWGLPAIPAVIKSIISIYTLFLSTKG